MRRATHLTVSGGGTLVVEGDFTSPSSSVTVEEGGIVQVNNGTLSVGTVVLILNEIPRPCESRVITVATANGAGTLPAVSFGNQLGTGVSGTPSFSGNTLSVVVNGEPPEGNPCFTSVDGEASLQEMYPWLVPLILLIGVVLVAIVFAIVIRRSYQYEVERKEKQDGPQKAAPVPSGEKPETD